MASNKVALITGGASGMGLEVATALARRGAWTVHILDLNPESGRKAASRLGATFHESDVTNEESLNSIFSNVFTQHQRLDFVFANAGIAERAYFADDQPGGSDGPPVPVKGMHALVDINLKSVITTSYLALHYMRLSPKDTDRSLVMTSSCGGIYPSYYSPIYTATKHAVVGFMRAIAPAFYRKAGVRVNATLPGIVKTNLLSGEEWANFPEEYFTPVEKIAEVVLMMVDGRDDGTGKSRENGNANGEEGKGLGVFAGKAVEVSGKNHYYREVPGFADDAMEAVMGATSMDSL